MNSRELTSTLNLQINFYRLGGRQILNFRVNFNSNILLKSRANIIFPKLWREFFQPIANYIFFEPLGPQEYEGALSFF